MLHWEVLASVETKGRTGKKKNIGFRHPNMNPTLYMLFQTGERDMLKVHFKIQKHGVIQAFTKHWQQDMKFLQVASRRWSWHSRGPRCVAVSMEDIGNSFILWSRQHVSHDTNCTNCTFFRREDPKIPSFSRIFCLLTKGMLQPSLPFSGHFNWRVDWGLMVCICLHRPGGPSFLSELYAFRFDIVWYCYLWRICDLPWPQHWKKVRSRQGMSAFEIWKIRCRDPKQRHGRHWNWRSWDLAKSICNWWAHSSAGSTKMNCLMPRLHWYNSSLAAFTFEYCSH